MLLHLILIGVALLASIAVSTELARRGRIRAGMLVFWLALVLAVALLVAIVATAR